MIRAAFFDIGKKVTTDSLYQWDTNQILEITGSGLIIAPPIHFGNKNHKEAVIVQSEIVDGVIRAAIPNTLVAEEYPIYAFLVIIENGASNTKQVFEIPVIPRPMPADYHFIDDKDVINYEYLSDRIVRFEYAVNQRVDGLETHINEYETNTTTEVTRLRLIVEAFSAQGLDFPLGMYNCETVFNEDGSIIERGEGWSKLTVFNEDESITETLRTTNEDGSTKVSVKQTTFNEDGSITAQITESYIEEVEEA